MKNIKKIQVVNGSLKIKPSVSVIIVSYKCEDGLLQCLSSISQQTEKNIEIVLIDNGLKRDIISYLKNPPIVYIKTKENLGCSEGRNLGAQFARADILYFVDDDAMLKEGCIDNHLKYYADPDIIAVRGRVFAKNSSAGLYNFFAPNYDCGNYPRRGINLDCEGNMSIRKDIFLEVGCFDSTINGGEGLDLMRRILSKYHDKNRLLYTPDAIIFHDFSSGLGHFVRKIFIYGINTGRSSKKIGRKFGSLCSLTAIKNLLFPGIKHYWKQYFVKNKISFKDYIALCIFCMIRNWLFKIGEISGYLQGFNNAKAQVR